MSSNSRRHGLSSHDVYCYCKLLKPLDLNVIFCNQSSKFQRWKLDCKEHGFRRPKAQHLILISQIKFLFNQVSSKYLTPFNSIYTDVMKHQASTDENTTQRMLKKHETKGSLD